MKFSQRIGKSPVKTKIQIEAMDNELRSALWNCFQSHYIDNLVLPSDTDRLMNLSAPRSQRHYNLGESAQFFRILWNDFFRESYDKLPNDFDQAMDLLRDRYFSFSWFQVYDFIEFVSTITVVGVGSEFIRACNEIFEQEVSGYRFIGGLIAPITNEAEIQSIQEALVNSKQGLLKGAHTHLSAALSKLSDRKNPDYRNSIKESISAVESVAQLISGNPKSELGQALKRVEETVGLHPALKKGFLAIYGYTSDADGIRHAMINTSTCDFDDAKYMLVSCSAFVNYLIMKAKKAGLIP